jgi:hypothetical protein
MFDNSLSALGDRFWQQYPQGSIVSDLVQIHGDQYVVKVSVLSANNLLVSMLAGDPNLVQAQNRAIEWALGILGIREAPELVMGASLADLPPNLTAVLATPAIREIPTGEEPKGNLSPPVVVPTINKTVQSLTIADPTIPLTTILIPLQEHSANEFSDKPSNWTPDEQITTAIVNSQVTPVNSVPLEIDLQLPATSIVEFATKTEKSEKTSTIPAPLPVDNAEVPLNETTAPVAEPLLSVTDMIPMINMELKRLGWSKDRGRDYMVSLYNKRASALLSDDELLGLLQHLQAEQIV